jgi:cellobiose phosphorylase
MPGFRVTRRYRGAVYDIEVKNPNGVQHGIAGITADGKPLDSNVLPPAPKGTTVHVEVIMG